MDKDEAQRKIERLRQWVHDQRVDLPRVLADTRKLIDAVYLDPSLGAPGDLGRLRSHARLIESIIALLKKSEADPPKSDTD